MKKSLISGLLIAITSIGFLFGFVEVLQKAFPKTTPFMKNPIVFLVNFVVLVISFLVFLTERFSKVKEVSESYYKEIHETIGSIKGVLPNGREIDVARRLLRMQLGDIADRILPSDASFPVTLVPGGDIALIMNQQDYGRMLSDLLSSYQSYNEIRWTTCVPFESLNKSLSYNPNEWEEKRLNGELNFVASCTHNYFSYVSKWAKLKRAKQIIILKKMNDPNHPLWMGKYADKGDYNLDILKYLSVRYGIYDNLNTFVSLQEGDFLNDTVKRNIKNKDKENSTVKWISLEEVENIVKENETFRNTIHNIDFVYFDKPGNDFALVRVDANNYYEINGGIVGVTFVIYTFHSLSVYSEFFKEMFDRARQTFYDLTEMSL